MGFSIPVVRTYLGGSVVCIFGGALLAYWGLISSGTMTTLSAFVNDYGFLTLYISGLITGSLFNIDRDLLLRASLKLLPVAVVSIAAGVLVCGLLGAWIGNGFWDSILYIGGRDVQRRDDRPVAKVPVTQLKLEKLTAGLLLSVGFYVAGALLNHFIPAVPVYAFMIVIVVAVKCTGLFPDEVEDSARQWGRFVIHAWTAVALFGIGITLIDLNVILSNLTPAFLVTVFLVELVITLTAAFLGKAVGFYPVESAIAAGMCTTNMGGSGNVAVLSGAERMELLPFAQIVTRSCGALMLTLGGILVRIFG